ncbi:MAG: serine/threonine protein kinase [Gammaproteobacteria bacterium]|nr:serine/threonine protein kinase [Gammaproteobacteria bacterium]
MAKRSISGNRAPPPPAPAAAVPLEFTPFATLSPDRVLEVIERLGYRTDGRLLALNSYENRVYRVGIEDEPAVIAKFYRAGRWSDPAIEEEHVFAAALSEAEIPVVAPLVNAGHTLHHDDDCRFALYPNRPGRAPELDDPEVLRWLGRFIGRIHALGSTTRFCARPALTIDRFGRESSAFILASEYLPAELHPVYQSVVSELLDQVQSAFDQSGETHQLRLHGDCHPGNILWAPSGPHFVDLDDCMSGPAVQDLWMLVAGDREEMSQQFGYLIEGYEDFHEFDTVELNLIEALRTLRIMHYAAWLARRWHDPAFPLHFPWFNTQRYWQDHILALREQQAALQEMPLRLPR